MPVEPESGAHGCVTVSLKDPEGKPHQRRFLEETKVQVRRENNPMSIIEINCLNCKIVVIRKHDFKSDFRWHFHSEFLIAVYIYMSYIS